MKKILGYLKDEQGIETLEWVAMGGLILGVAILAYPGALGGAITATIAGIAAQLATAV
jgi:Flp pilus assembly pilin Flp